MTNYQFCGGILMDPLPNHALFPKAKVEPFANPGEAETEPRPRPPVPCTPPGVAEGAVKALRTLGMLKARAEAFVKQALTLQAYSNVAELIVAAMKEPNK